MSKRVIVSIIFIAFSFSPYRSLVYAKNRQDLKEEVSVKEKAIASINKRIKKQGKEINSLRERKFSILDEIHNLEIRLEKGEYELTRLEKRQKVTDRNIKEVEKEIGTLQDRKQIIEASLKKRLIAIYKNRQAGILKVVFSTDTLDNMGRNLKLIKTLVNYDMLLLNEYRENQNSLREKKEGLYNHRFQLDMLKREHITKKEELFRQKDKRASLIKEVEKKEGIKLVALKELERQSLELQSLIERLREEIKEEEPEKTGISFSSMKGKLEMPVDGKTISLYGKVKHPKFKTETFNKGIEIRTHIGDEVRSIFQGKVVYEGWLKGYGKVMIINHGAGYYTLFAHLSKNLKDVGENVKRFDVIALAGDTGSLKGPVLYFEVRFHGVPQNPLEWIAQR
ncbi:MAG: murein hydrolase activator EnvC family protein [Thermodesulfobacteriota bacterium]